MEGAEEQAPLSRAFGLLLIEDFCSSTGLDRATVEALLREGRIDGVVFDERGGVVGLVDDVLPTGEQLRAMGLVVSSTYVPDELRSFEDDDVGEDPDESQDTGPTWTMTWD